MKATIARPGSVEHWNDYSRQYDDARELGSHSDRYKIVWGYLNDLLGTAVVRRGNSNSTPSSHEATTTLWWIARSLTGDELLRHLFAIHCGGFIINCHTAREPYDVLGNEVHLFQLNNPLEWDAEEALRHTATILGYINYNDSPSQELEEYQRFNRQHRVIPETHRPDDEAAMMLGYAYLQTHSLSWKNAYERRVRSHPDPGYRKWFRRRWASFSVNRP